MSPQKLLWYVWQHRSNQHRRLSAVGSTLAWQFRKRFIRRPIDIPVFGNMKLRCFPDSRGAGVMIYTSGWPDYDEMHFVRRYLRPGDGFVDVGANIGIYTLLAASCIGDQGHLLAFEAGRRQYQRLSEIVALNQLENVVSARFAAVGPETGTVQFLQQHDLINRIAVAGDEGPGSQMEVVPCVTLDESLGSGTFAMGKIDIEGAEPMAFRGGQQILRAGNPPVWLLELKDRLLRRFDSSAASFAAFLDQHGFRLAIYNADANQLSFPPKPWEEHGNVLAIHRDHVQHVEDRLNERRVPSAANLT